MNIPERAERAAVIGKRLVELRGIRTRTGVAKEIGVSYSSLCNYENGCRIPPDDVKIRIAAYYGVSVDEIFFAK